MNMRNPIRWGILATGGIARLQTRDLLANNHVVAAVGSRNPESAREFADYFDIPAAFGSYEELCESPEVDIVYVASPHSYHHEHAMLALRAGKHAMVEKAFTLDSIQAGELKSLATENDLFLMEAMWTRFLPSMKWVLDIIDRGGIGDLQILIADHNQYIPYEAAPRLYDPALGGGALLDLGVYPLSLAQMLFGEPSTVQAEARLNRYGTDEMTGMMLSYDTGAQAVLHCGTSAPGANRAVIAGSAGRIEMEKYWYTQTVATHYDRDGGIVSRYEESIMGRGMQFQANEAVDCIERGLIESPVRPLEDTISVLRTMDTIRQKTGVRYPHEG